MFRGSFRRPPLFLDFYDLGSVSQVSRDNYPERLVHENFLSLRGELERESTPGLVKPFRALAAPSLDSIFEGSPRRWKYSQNHDEVSRYSIWK